MTCFEILQKDTKQHNELSSLQVDTAYSIQINQPTRCNNFSSLLLGVYLQLNTFRASSCPSSGAQQLQ
jgi:hypothetical protein